MPLPKKPAVKKPAEPLSPEVALTGLLALMVDERESRLADDYQPRKTVSLLSDAGLGVDEIAQVVNKNSPAVAKAIQRDKKAKKKGSDG